MEFGEMKRNTSNWSNFCMLSRRAGVTASAGLSCYRLRTHEDWWFHYEKYLCAWQRIHS